MHDALIVRSGESARRLSGVVERFAHRQAPPGEPLAQ